MANNTTDSSSEYGPQNYNKPLIVISGLFAAIFIFGPLFVRKGPNKSIVRCCIMMSSFCMWLFWSSMYIEQMNPILGPRMKNSTVAWIAYKYGDPVKPTSLDEF